MHAYRFECVELQLPGFGGLVIWIGAPAMAMIMNTHWFTHSGMTGLTLPGMIDEPA